MIWNSSLFMNTINTLKPSVVLNLFDTKAPQSQRQNSKAPFYMMSVYMFTCYSLRTTWLKTALQWACLLLEWQYNMILHCSHLVIGPHAEHHHLSTNADPAWASGIVGIHTSSEPDLSDTHTHTVYAEYCLQFFKTLNETINISVVCYTVTWRDIQLSSG